MRYPLGKDNQDFLKRFYSAQEFGKPTSYGFHEGEDFNTRTGGDSDLGEPLYAVADGKIVYYHNNSHPSTGFGRHMVLQCETPRGTRWYGYNHCQEIITQVKEVKEGEVIGKLGKSGTPVAHLHFSVFKVDPSSLYKGIDSIAKTQADLNAYWEKFELLSMPEKTYTQAEWQLERDERNKNWTLYQNTLTKVTELENNIADRAKATEEKDRQDQDYFDSLVVTLAPDPDEVKGMTNKEIVKYEVNKFIDRESNLQKQLKDLQKEKDEEVRSLNFTYQTKIRELEIKLGSAEETIDDLKVELDKLKELKPPTNQPPTEKPISRLFTGLSRVFQSVFSSIRKILWLK